MGASILVPLGQAQFNAVNHVYLGNQPNDDVQIGTLGTVTTDAHFELDAGVVLDGRAPVENPLDFGSDSSFGISVEQTMYASSVAEIIQELGELHVRNLALEAGQYVHLASVASFNETIAIAADAPGPLTDPNLIMQISTLGNVENGEVDPALPQSIAFLHQGSADLNLVTSPTGAAAVEGLTSLDGSIFVSSTNAILINRDIIATSNTVDPQITLYVANGTATDPGIEFAATEIIVSGPNNQGIVNQPFTTATFFDAQGFVFEGTTEILVLNSDGSADQNIVLQYASPGEAGYRVGVVWDIENQPGNPVENPNTFVPNVSDPTEAFDDAIYQNNPTTLHLFGGNEGAGRETIGKIEAYSKDAIISHQFDPKVFSRVTVRNDQNINLFFGPLNAVDNSLNETSVTIRADLDAPKKFALALPPISQINPIEVRTITDVPVQSSSPDDVSTSSFERDVQQFETGELKWVRVKIPLADLESFGDEVRLKDPTKIYLKAADAKEFEIDAEIGENEIEKIIRAIETNRETEAGYWYKVFKDYQNRDDELFFYHLKTGEVPQLDEGPESNFLDTDSSDNGDSNEVPQPVDDSKPTRPEENGVSNRLPETERLSAHNIRTVSAAEISPSTANLGVSASSLLVAGLLLDRRRQSKTFSERVGPDVEEVEPIDRLKSTGFGRLARLKRRLHDDWKTDQRSP